MPQHWNFTLKYTSIYQKCTQFKFRKNMRSDVKHAKWLLVISNDITDTLEIPNSWNFSNNIQDIYNTTIWSNSDLPNRTILASHNDDVHVLINKILYFVNGDVIGFAVY